MDSHRFILLYPSSGRRVVCYALQHDQKFVLNSPRPIDIHEVYLPDRTNFYFCSSSLPRQRREPPRDIFLTEHVLLATRNRHPFTRTTHTHSICGILGELSTHTHTTHSLTHVTLYYFIRKLHVVTCIYSCIGCYIYTRTYWAHMLNAHVCCNWLVAGDTVVVAVVVMC